MVSKDMFGGLSVLLLGDVMQLKPVKAVPIFSMPKSSKNRVLYKSSESLWRNFEVVVLETNFRQGNKNPWKECLSRLRVLEYHIDMTEEDKALLESRRLKNNPGHNLDNAHHVFFRNEDANKLNQEKLNALETELVEIKADLIHPKGYAPSVTKHGTIDDTQFMKSLKVKVRAKVMLVYNINTSDSLVNGALGHILDIIKIENSSEVKAIIIEF